VGLFDGQSLATSSITFHLAKKRSKQFAICLKPDTWFPYHWPNLNPWADLGLSFVLNDLIWLFWFGVTKQLFDCFASTCLWLNFSFYGL